MKELFAKYKKRLAVALAVAALGAAAYFNGVPVDWAKIASDAGKGEVTDTAQQLEDSVKNPE